MMQGDIDYINAHRTQLAKRGFPHQCLISSQYDWIEIEKWCIDNIGSYSLFWESCRLLSVNVPLHCLFGFTRESSKVMFSLRWL